jgi:ankyrin repeat protein
MNDNLSGGRSKARRGTGNKGQEYEVLLPALFALIFYKDSTVKDFTFHCNVNNFGNFDDLLVHLVTENGEEYYAFQFKHKEQNNLHFCPSCWQLSTKHEFGLVKYCENFSRISDRDKYRFIIFTNAYPNPTRFHEVTKFDVESNGDCPGKKFFFCPSTKDCNNQTARIYNFRVNDATEETDLATREVYISFFSRLSFYSLQKNNHDVQKLIVDEFGKIFGTNDPCVAMGYISIFRSWNMHEFSKLEFTRDELKVKIFDLILSPHVITPSCHNSNQKFVLLDRAFSKFDFSIVKNLDEKAVEKIGSLPHFEPHEDVLHIGKNMKFLTKNVTKKNCKESELKHKIGYYRKEKPLTVKIHPANETAVIATISQFKKHDDKLHFVLAGQNQIELERLNRFRIFETLYDLAENESDIYQQMIKELKICVMGKEYSYEALFGDDRELAKRITIEHMFQMLAGKFHHEVEKETLPSPYISRVVTTTLVKMESIDEIFNSLVVVSQIGDLKIIEVLKKKLDKKVLTVEEYLTKDIVSGDVIVCGDKLTEEDLERICQKSSMTNIHHFEYHSRHFLEWVSTVGSIEGLKKCDVVKKPCVKESDIHDKFRNNINVLCARSGTGKSEMFKMLKNTCPPDYFPLKISLKEHNSFFKDSHDNAEIVNYFLNQSQDDFVLVHIKQNFAKNKKIFFFFDGLDELHGENLRSAVTHIKQLVTMGFRIWVSSKPNILDLEDCFNVFSVEIVGFTDQEQEDYVKGRLSGLKNVDGLTEQIFRNVDAILQNKDILDVPLQLYMTTETILEDPGQVSSNMFVLTRMLHYFIIGRYRHFFRKNKCPHFGSLEQVLTDSMRYRMTQYQIAALEFLLSKNDFRSLNVQNDEEFLQRVKTQGDFLGIISRITHGIVVFNYNIIASYFAAQWFAEHRHNIADFLQKILFRKEFVHIRLLFDMILAEDFPAHVAVLYRDVAAIQENKTKIYDTDKGGRTAFHLAFCRYPAAKSIKDEITDHDTIVNMRKIDNECATVLKYLLGQQHDPLKEDTLFQWSALDFADKTLFLLPLELILEKNENLKEKILQLNVFQKDNWSILYYSAIFSYTNLFKNAFVKNNLDDKQIEYLLHLAITWNSWQIVNVLLNNQVDINSSTKSGKTPLHLACAFGHVELAILLLLKDGNVNAGDLHDRTPLHLASLEGHVKVIKQLFGQAKPLVDPADKFGRTPLHLAVESGVKDAVQFLLDKGAKINRPAWNGWTPLHLAVEENQIDIVELLLEKGANGDAVDEYGNKPLHIAAKRRVEILELLLERSGQVDDPTRCGETSLLLAAKCGNKDAVEFLLKNSANINARDNTGKSVLHLAVIGQKKEIVEVLMRRRDLDFTVVDNNGETCLHRAVDTGNLDIVKLLLGKMSKLVNVQATNGSTVLHWAFYKNHKAIIDLLVDKGAKADIVDREGKTPRQWGKL